jgi:polysaccharide biosynthesis protein PslJ
VIMAQRGTALLHANKPSESDSPERERTPWLLAFFCLLIPVLPASSVVQGPLRSYGSPARLIAFALFLLAVLGFVLSRRTLRSAWVRPGMVFVLTYLLFLLMVYGVGVSHLDSPAVEASKTRSLFNLLVHVGVAMYAMTRVQTVRQRNILLGCLAIGLTFNNVVGLLQSFTHVDLHLLFQPPGFVSTVDIQGRNLSGVITERLGAIRAFGTSGHAIEFSVLAAVTVPLTMHFARYATSRLVRQLSALAAVVALLAMPAGVSRSGVVALLAATAVYIWAFKLRKFATIVSVGAVACLLGFAASPRTGQALWLTVINSAQDNSVLERIGRYARVSQTLHEHPAFGLGLGAALPDEYGYLDNEWLMALVQGGMAGFVAMALIAGGAIFGIAAALRCADTPRERDQAYSLGAMSVGILASSFTFDLFTFQQATLVLFLLFGLLWSNFTVAIPQASGSRQPQ